MARVPSSLTLRTGPWNEAASAAVVRARLDGAGGEIGLGRDPQDGAVGQEAALQIGHDSAIDAGDRFEDKVVEVGHVLVTDEVVKDFACRGAERDCRGRRGRPGWVR